MRDRGRVRERGDDLRPQQRGIEGEARRLVRVRVSGRFRVRVRVRVRLRLRLKARVRASRARQAACIAEGPRAVRVRVG